MRSTRCLLPCLLLCALLIVSVPARGAEESHFPTSEDLRHLKSMGGPQLSPDGKFVLLSVTDATADGAQAHIWVVATAGGADTLHQLTFSPPSDKRGERNAQWAPDGSAIFFIAKRGEHTQLFRLDMRGGEASPYDLKVMPAVDESKAKDAIPPPGAEKKPEEKKEPEKKPEEKKDEPLPIDVNGYSLSADGKWIAVWAKDPETPGEKKQKDAKADARWVNHDEHGVRLYLAALKADGSIDGGLKPMAVEPDVRGAIWSPVADTLLVITNKPNEQSDLGPANAAWVLNAAISEASGNSPLSFPVSRLEAIPATVGGAAWSPDGSRIVFAAATPEDAPPGYDELFALRMGEIGAKPVRLSAGFAGQLNAGALYFPTDGSLIAQAGVGTRTAVVRLALDGKKAPEPLDLGASVITGLNTNRKQTGWVWIADSGGQPEELCAAQHLGDACTPLPIPELAPANLRRVKPEIVKWKNGSMSIEGLLYLPPQAASGKVPLVVDVHGGPAGAWEDRNDYFASFIVGHGWAVLRPNPRGSSNYGVAFEAANKNDLGGGDYQDIMAGVDYALSKYSLDGTRMALMGYSYGGEMAAFVEGKTDRFKAIISEAPVIDQFSEYGTEGGSWYDRWYYGKPWRQMEDAWRQSPLSGAAHAKTPFLLIQGESDNTDPLGQAQEMYRALRQEGVPVELVTYPREDHGPLGGGIFGRPAAEPWHGFDGRQRIIEFLEKELGAGEANQHAMK